MTQDQLDCISKIVHGYPGKDTPWANFIFFLNHEALHGDLTEEDAAQAYDYFRAEFGHSENDRNQRMAQISKIKRQIRHAQLQRATEILSEGGE